LEILPWGILLSLAIPFFFFGEDAFLGDLDLEREVDLLGLATFLGEDDDVDFLAFVAFLAFLGEDEEEVFTAFRAGLFEASLFLFEEVDLDFSGVDGAPLEDWLLVDEDFLVDLADFLGEETDFFPFLSLLAFGLSLYEALTLT